jgi:hypothetical protein
LSVRLLLSASQTNTRISRLDNVFVLTSSFLLGHPSSNAGNSTPFSSFTAFNALSASSYSEGRILRWGYESLEVFARATSLRTREGGETANEDERETHRYSLGLWPRPRIGQCLRCRRQSRCYCRCGFRCRFRC